MKCYKLVFNFKYFIKNAGSIIVLIIIFAYIVFMIYFFVKDISPLKLYIANNFLRDEIEQKDAYPKITTLNSLLTYSEKKDKKNKNKSKKNVIKNSKNGFLYPPKKSRANRSSRIGGGEKRKDNKRIEQMKLVDIIDSKSKLRKMYKFHNINSNKNLILKDNNDNNKKSVIDLEKEKEFKIKMEKEKKREKILNLLSDYKLRKYEEDDVKEKKTDIKKPIKIKEKEEILLDDYELNHSEYEIALKKDKRSFWQIYWSILKRDQLILFGFASWNDYNLYYVKIVRFLFTILTLMAMNGFLYADKSIHYLYINGVKYNFGKQILQIVLSIIITHVMEILLCFLSLTDRHIYEIKGLPKTEATANRIFEILRKMKIKLIIFYIMVVLISLFYWYFISAFCAVYHNTQGLYIVDCVISFIFFSIDPFIIYALVTLLRVLSFKKISNKKIKWLYTISRLFPVF